jgi:hypothetical protein
MPFETHHIRIDSAGNRLPHPVRINSRPFIIDPFHEFSRSCVDSVKDRAARDLYQDYHGSNGGGETDLPMPDTLEEREAQEELLWQYLMESGPEPFDPHTVAQLTLEASRCKHCGFLPDNCVCRYRRTR